LFGYAEDLLDVCAALELDAPIFVGHSVSCMIGVKADIMKPGYFSSLILVAPSPSYINDDQYVGGLDQGDIEGLLSMMEDNYLGWSAVVAPQIIGNPDRPELGEELTSNFCATDPVIARQFARVTFLSDSREDLNKVSVPSLTLQCSDDMLAPLEVGHYIKNNTPQNTLVILKAKGPPGDNWCNNNVS
jgi:sigma-B regulation protein RsbQ